MNKNILIVILIIIVLAILGTIIFSQANSSVDTEINFISANNLNNGDNVTFELKDVQGNALSNKTVNIKFTKDGQTQSFTVTTDSNGKGYLTLSNESNGACEVIVNFGGDDKYKASTATQTITIGDASSDQESQNSTSSASTSNTQTTSNSSSSSNLNYDSELNIYYDNNGVIKGGQNDGESYEYIKNNPPQVDEQENLV